MSSDRKMFFSCHRETVYRSSGFRLAARCAGKVWKLLPVEGPFWWTLGSSAGPKVQQQRARVWVTSSDPGKAGEESTTQWLYDQSRLKQCFWLFYEINSSSRSLVISRLDFQGHGGPERKKGTSEFQQASMCFFLFSPLNKNETGHILTHTSLIADEWVSAAVPLPTHLLPTAAAWSNTSSCLASPGEVRLAEHIRSTRPSREKQSQPQRNWQTLGMLE